MPVASLPYLPGSKLTVAGGPGQGTHAASDWQSGRAVDIGLAPGTPVLAVSDAVVVRVSGHDPSEGIIISGIKRLFGQSVTIRDSAGREWFYTHIRASVRQGQNVRAGQPVGTVATAGTGWFSHLHLATSAGDPREALRAGATSATGAVYFTRDGQSVSWLPDAPSLPLIPGLPILPGPSLPGIPDLDSPMAAALGWLLDPLLRPMVRLGMILGGTVLFVLGAAMLSRAVSGAGEIDLAGAARAVATRKVG